MDSVKLSQYFERHSMRCPLLQAFNRLHFSPSRKKLLQLLLFIVFVCVVCNFYQISDCVKELTQGRSRVQDTHTDQPQPSDGGVDGHSNTNGGGHGNEKPGEGAGGGSHDPPQAPSSSGGGSSSNGDNGGDDDPNKKRPTRSRAQESMEVVESKEEETIEDDESSSYKDEMVTTQLQPLPERLPQFSDTRRHIHQGGSVVPAVCSNPWASSSHASVKSFEHSEQLRMCPLDETAVIHEASNDEGQPQQQLPQSAASIGEEQLNLELSSITNTEEILDQLSFYTTIEIESFSGPQSPSHSSQEVSTESIQALHANTYYDLAHLEEVQQQVLQAAETMEPFDYTLAIVMYHHGSQLLIPCLPDAEFDPAEDVHVVAIPADCVVSEFTVHINPLLHHLQ